MWNELSSKNRKEKKKLETYPIKSKDVQRKRKRNAEKK